MQYWNDDVSISEAGRQMVSRLGPRNYNTSHRAHAAGPGLHEVLYHRNRHNKVTSVNRRPTATCGHFPGRVRDFIFGGARAPRLARLPQANSLVLHDL